MLEFLMLIIAVALCVHIFRRIQYKNSNFYRQTQTPYNKVIFDKGVKGEFRTSVFLEPFLAQSARILYNVYIPTKKQKTTEIDVILISHSGLFVIESKNFSGWIFGNSNQKQWCQTLPARYGCEKYHFYNPIWQNDTHIRCLRALLGSTTPCYSIIVFSDKCTLKNVSVNDASANVIYAHELPYLIQHIQNIEGKVLDDERIDDIYTTLWPYAHADDYTKAKHRYNVSKKQY